MTKTTRAAVATKTTSPVGRREELRQVLEHAPARARDRTPRQDQGRACGGAEHTLDAAAWTKWRHRMSTLRKTSSWR